MSDFYRQKTGIIFIELSVFVLVVGMVTDLVKKSKLLEGLLPP